MQIYVFFLIKKISIKQIKEKSSIYVIIYMYNIYYRSTEGLNICYTIQDQEELNATH